MSKDETASVYPFSSFGYALTLREGLGGSMIYLWLNHFNQLKWALGVNIEFVFFDFQIMCAKYVNSLEFESSSSYGSFLSYSNAQRVSK